MADPGRGRQRGGSLGPDARVAERKPLSLEEPQPLFIVLGYGDSAINLQFSVWGLRENFLELRNSIQREIKEAFDREGIEIPFPHRSLYAGSVTQPLPVRLVAEGQAPGSASQAARGVQAG